MESIRLSAGRPATHVRDRDGLLECSGRTRCSWPSNPQVNVNIRRQDVYYIEAGRLELFAKQQPLIKKHWGKLYMPYLKGGGQSEGEMPLAIRAGVPCVIKWPADFAGLVG